MPTVAVMRAWYNTGTQYIYWSVEQISDPLSEYPSGGGYPAAATLSDFVLFDYNRLAADAYYTGVDIPVEWGSRVSTSNVVYLTYYGLGNEIVRLTDALTYVTSAAIGVASEVDFVRTSGIYDVYCESAAYPGDNLFVSAVNPGYVTADFTMVQNRTLCPVGVAVGYKAAVGAGTVAINIDPREPLLLEENIP